MHGEGSAAFGCAASLSVICAVKFTEPHDLAALERRSNVIHVAPWTSVNRVSRLRTADTLVEA